MDNPNESSPKHESSRRIRFPVIIFGSLGVVLLLLLGAFLGRVTAPLQGPYVPANTEVPTFASHPTVNISAPAEEAPHIITNTRQVAAASLASTAKKYKVVRHDDLHKIADRYGVTFLAMATQNSDYLRGKYEGACGHLSERYRNTSAKGHVGPRRNQRRGTYCNDRYARAYLNTLQPGWEVEIPENTAPASINSAVQQIAGNRIALVIDRTDSMSNDREQVAAYYHAAIQKYSKQLVGVWLYSDNEVQMIHPSGNIDFATWGSTENTHAALKAAAAEKPDAIILITDEPGDDWHWSEISTATMPPVIAHCIVEGSPTCQNNLQHLKQVTGGQYMEGLG